MVSSSPCLLCFGPLHAVSCQFLRDFLEISGAPAHEKSKDSIPTLPKSLKNFAHFVRGLTYFTAKVVHIKLYHYLNIPNFALPLNNILHKQLELLTERREKRPTHKATDPTIPGVDGVYLRPCSRTMFNLLLDVASASIILPDASVLYDWRQKDIRGTCIHTGS